MINLDAALFLYFRLDHQILDYYYIYSVNS
jgi:hypothetical protein